MAIGSREPANASFFIEPERSKQIAHARKGMWDPTVETLSPDRHKCLYRLGHWSVPGASSLEDEEKETEENLSSPWWMDFENYIAIKIFAEINSVSLTISSRVQNAHAPDFGPANMLYIVTLKAPLMVLRGVGRDINCEGRVYRPTVLQTFVPGLRAWPKKTRSKIWHDAFLSYTSKRVVKGMISLYDE